jgi:flagella basal body P-ring formation protein FlgA
MPWDADAAVVDVKTPAGDCQVSDGEVSVVWRKDPQYEYLGPGTFRGEIRVNGQVERTVFAKANIAAYDAVVVATQPIGRGYVISAGNARMEKRDLSTLDPGAFFSMDAAAGRVARTAILPGQALNARRLDLPALVKRNQIVAVETRVGGLVIRGQAKAQSDAAAGAGVVCVNPGSNLKFSGVVRADGVVEVK